MKQVYNKFVVDAKETGSADLKSSRTSSSSVHTTETIVGEGGRGEELPDVVEILTFDRAGSNILLQVRSTNLHLIHVGVWSSSTSLPDPYGWRRCLTKGEGEAWEMGQGFCVRVAGAFMCVCVLAFCAFKAFGLL